MQTAANLSLSWGVQVNEKLKKDQVMYDSLLWETEQNEEFLHFMEPGSLLICSKQPHLEKHTKTSILHLLILFIRNPLQYYTPILYSVTQNSISNFISSNTCLHQFRSLHIHAPCPAYHILDLSPQYYLVQNQSMKLLIFTILSSLVRELRIPASPSTHNSLSWMAGFSRFFSASSSNWYHGTRSCFTKSYDGEAQTTVVLTEYVVSCTIAAKFWFA